MGEIIYYKDKTIKALFCDHPSVEKIWEFGGASAIPTAGTMKRILCLKIKEFDEPIAFEDDGTGDAISKAEQYLQSLK